MVPRSRRFVGFLLALLAVNLVLSFITGQPEDRSQVPYQPFFVDQLNAGDVSEITSQADSIEGGLKKKAQYDPPGDKKPFSVTRFKTQVPAFIDRAELTKEVSDQDVVVNAKPPDAGRSFLGSLLLGLLPTLLLVGFFLWIARRSATAAGAGGLLLPEGRRPSRWTASKLLPALSFRDAA